MEDQGHQGRPGHCVHSVLSNEGSTSGDTRGLEVGLQRSGFKLSCVVIEEEGAAQLPGEFLQVRNH